MLKRKGKRRRILCGDFNTPQQEEPDGTVMTWGERRNRKGEIRTLKGFAEWDEAERSVLTGLANHDLPDVFRSLHGYGREEFSWYLKRKGKLIGRRFDHVFASRVLRPTRCEYLHAVRERGLSDHSPILAVFSPSP